MNQREHNRIVSEIRRFRLASSDMEQAATAANALGSGKSHAFAFERALETAIAVCYARPFTNDSDNRLDQQEWGPDDPADVELHERLMWLRSKLYAHVDPESGRGIHGPYTIKVLNEDEPPLVLDGLSNEKYPRLPRDLLPQIIDLAVRLSERYDAEAGARQAHLLEAARVE